jgi:hypothetical protein
MHTYTSGAHPFSGRCAQDFSKTVLIDHSKPYFNITTVGWSVIITLKIAEVLTDSRISWFLGLA